MIFTFIKSLVLILLCTCKRLATLVEQAIRILPPRNDERKQRILAKVLLIVLDLKKMQSINADGLTYIFVSKTALVVEQISVTGKKFPPVKYRRRNYLLLYSLALG